jgi:PAS domain S-box-containing protein
MERTMIRRDGSEQSRAFRKSEEALRRARQDRDARFYQRATSERTDAEALYEGQLWLTTITESALDAIIATKADGRILLFNPAAERMFRCSAAVAAGQLVDRFIPSTALESSGERERLRAVRADGDEFDAEAAISHIEVAGEQLRTYILRDIEARDVSQPTETGALRRLNEHLELQAGSIAHALHDEAGQLLTSAYIALTEAARELPPAARDRLHDVRKHLDGIEDQLRRVAHELRPLILDDLGLVPALEFLAQSVQQRRGISIAVEAALERRLPAAVEITLYRLVQEALTNVSKHAQALHVTIRLEHRGRALRCVIEDDGVGFNAAGLVARQGEQGLGLIGIRNRLEALGGTFEINSAPGRGTELVVTIPLET